MHICKLGLRALFAVVFASLASAQVNCVTNSFSSSDTSVNIQYGCYDFNPPNQAQFDSGIIPITGQFTHYRISETHDFELVWDPLQIGFSFSGDPQNDFIGISFVQEGTGGTTASMLPGPITAVHVTGSLSTSDSCNFGPCFFQVQVTLTP